MFNAKNKYENVNLWKQPDPQSQPIDSLAYGQKVEFIGRKTTNKGYTWAEIKVNSKKGWIVADYLVMNPPPPLRNMSDALYGGLNGMGGTYSGISCGYNGYPSWQSGAHEGIDFQYDTRKNHHNNGMGKSVYSLINGEIIQIWRKGTPCIFIYDKEANKTVVYEHVSISSTIEVGNQVYAGKTILGTESDKGIPSSGNPPHTHIQVEVGETTSLSTNSDKKLSCPDPTAYWKLKGYYVK